MQKMRFFGGAALFTFLIVGFLIPMGFAAEPVILVTGEWAPYVSQKIPGYGFTAETVQAVFAEMGRAIEFRFLPWKRCEVEIKKGNAFAAFPYHISDARLKEFDFSDVIGESTWKFFYLKSNVSKELNWETLRDLKDYRIGCSLGNWYDKAFREAGLIRQGDYAKSDELSFKKLWRGRADLVPTDELVGWDIVRRLFPQSINQFGTLAQPLKVGTLHLMISRAYPNSHDLKTRFNAALSKLRQNGKLADIHSKWKQ